MAREPVHGERFVQTLQCPGLRALKRLVARDRDGLLDELRLATRPVRRHDHAARDGVRDFSPMIRAHDVQAQIDACRQAGGR